MSKVARVALTLLLPVVSIAVVAAIFEIGLRLTGHVAIYEMYSKPTLFWRYDELLGWSHEPGAHGVYVGPRPWPIEFRGRVAINSLGLRGPEIPPREAEERRVLFSGDSVVVGFEVDYEQTFASRLEEMLGERLGVPVRTINAGVRGYGTDQDYLYFRERGWRLEPDLVVFFHSGNDPSDNTTLHEMRRPFGKPALSLTSRNTLEIVGAPVPRYPSCSEVLLSPEYQAQRVDTVSGRLLCNAQLLLFDHSALFSYVTLAIPWDSGLLRWLYYLGNPHAEHLVGSRQSDSGGFAGRLTTAIVLAFADEARRHGAGFILVGHSALEQLDLEAIDRAGVPFVDLRPLAEDVGLRWRHDSHFNPEGHQRVADTLVGPIESRLRATAPVANARTGSPDPASP